MTERAAFRITPDLRFLYPQPAHEAAFAALDGAMRRGAGLALVDGEVGTGKTILLRRLEASLRSSGLRPRYIPYSELSIAALLDWADGGAASRPTGRPVPSSVLLLDDAGNCANELLSGLHELAVKRRERPYGPQVVLVGGTTLWPRILRELPKLAELIDTRVAMYPLGADEIGEYVRHRLQVAGRPADLFLPEAIAAIAAYSRGVPRLVNQVCSRALILADLEQTATISQETIAEAIEDCPAALFEQNGRTAATQAAPEGTPASPPDPVTTAASEPEPATALPLQPPEKAQPTGQSEPEPVPPTAEPTVQPSASLDVAPLPPAVADAADTAQQAPPTSAQHPLANQRRKEGRLKFKAVDAEKEAAASPHAPLEPSETPPAYSGFVPRQKSLAVQPAPADLPAPGAVTAAFSGFIPRRKEQDSPAAASDPGPSASAGGRRRRTRAAATGFVAVAIAGGVFYAYRVSPSAAEAARDIAGAAADAVRDAYVRIGALLRH